MRGVRTRIATMTRPMPTLTWVPVVLYHWIDIVRCTACRRWKSTRRETGGQKLTVAAPKAREGEGARRRGRRVRLVVGITENR